MYCLPIGISSTSIWEWRQYLSLPLGQQILGKSQSLSSLHDWTAQNVSANGSFGHFLGTPNSAEIDNPYKFNTSFF